jgi:hypothetical protein
MNHPRIRRYCRGDRTACLHLFEGNIPDSFAPHEIPGFMEFLDHFTGPYLVIEVANEVVACGGLAEALGTVTLCWGMVARDRQKRGLGRLLLRARLALAVCSPSARLVIMNTSQRTAAFFAKEGFATRRVTPNSYGPGLDRHDMEMRLVPAMREKIATYLPALQAAWSGGTQEIFSYCSLK